MNPTERMTRARQNATPARKNKIDTVQYFVDKAARLAAEAEAAAATKAPETVALETDAERQRRLTAAMTKARSED